MEAKYITLTKENIEKEHICCAFSDKKCKDSYELKKTWLKNEFENGYVFRRLDERAKVFIEYGPAEKAWVPVNAPNYLILIESAVYLYVEMFCFMYVAYA